MAVVEQWLFFKSSLSWVFDMARGLGVVSTHWFHRESHERLIGSRSLPKLVHRHNERHREVLLGQPRSGLGLRRNPQHASLIQEWTGSRRERLVVTEKVAALGVV